MRILTNMLAPKEYECRNESGNKVLIDMYDTKDKDHFSPMESVLGALAACASVDLVEMINKRKRELTDLKIETIAERRAEHPRAFTEITQTFTLFSSDIEQKEAEKLVELASGKYCSVAASLKVKISHKVVIRRK